MNVPDAIKQIAVALTISAVVSVSGLFYSTGTQKVLLEKNIEVTEKIQQAIVDLRIQNAVSAEKFVTREQLKQELKEYKHGS